MIDGVQACSSYGRAYTYQGASIACSKRCVIAEGLPTNVLPNGRPRVLHGMRSSQGCPLISTLNGTDGISSESTIFPAFVPDGEGEWRGIAPPDTSHEKEFDEYFIVLEQETGKPARRRFYRITLDTGEIIEGYTDEQLGHWRKTKQPFVRLYALGESRGTCPDDYLIVNNQKFTAHREETGKGGDLMVFSDIRTTKLRTPYRFRLTSKDIQSILLQSHAK
ncbi:DUF6402 family protein [Herbaspirillum huttiense]|uniref:DUF6402 family protein n=1 Tax=Herbaspirillum huttiense TaxID=863372 RepID=UPI0039AF7213